MSTLTPVSISKAGLADLDASLAAADSGGDKYANASGLFILMKNADSGSHTLTVAAPFASAESGNLGALDVDPITLVVADADIGLLAVPAGYADANGDIAWTYDAVTSVTIGVFSVAP